MPAGQRERVAIPRSAKNTEPRLCSRSPTTARYRLMVLGRLQKLAWSKPLSYLAHMLQLYRFVHRGATNPWEGCGLAASGTGTRQVRGRACVTQRRVGRRALRAARDGRGGLGSSVFGLALYFFGLEGLVHGLHPTPIVGGDGAGRPDYPRVARHPCFGITIPTPI
jgi:hypothetical protein